MSRFGSPMTVGGGVNVQPGRDGGDTYLVPSVDVGFVIGDRLVLLPSVGLCTGGGSSELTLGGGVGFKLFSNPDGRVNVNFQSHVAWISGDGGNQTATPLLAAGSWAVGDAASLIGGAGILVSRFSYSHDGHGHSHTDTDPVGFVGVGLGLGAMDLSAALEARKGEYDTDIGLMLGVAVPLGQR